MQLVLDRKGMGDRSSVIPVYNADSTEDSRLFLDLYAKLPPRSVFQG